mgnify:CR=1 FL=1
MAISTRFVLSQGPAIKGMGQAALSVLRQRLGLGSSNGTPSLPGPAIHVTYPPRDPALVRAYIKHVGGDPTAYKRRVPAHFFPQWGFGLTGPALEGLSYPMAKAMNGGCKLIQTAPLPADEPLDVVARLESIDDDGHRAILDLSIVTSTRSAPNAVEAHLYIFVPLEKRKGEAPKDKARVPADAKEIAFHRLEADAGLDFAKLTGDFNPVHWVPAYAKAFGFRNTILHGFGTMARAVEGLNRGPFAGDIDALRSIHVRFTRPVVLPAQVGVYVHDDEIYVGAAPSGPAYLTGTFETRNS